MKILWVVNTVIPEIGRLTGIAFGNAGGWLSGISENLVNTDGYNLVMCFPYQKMQIDGETEKIRYHSFRTEGLYKYSKEAERRFTEVFSIEKPDLIHIFGTEFPHTLAAVNAAERCGLLEKTIISVQGLVSIYEKHFFTSLPERIIHKYPIRDLLRHDNVFWQSKKYALRGTFEIEALQKVKHVIGRTDWDRACVYFYNKNVQYHFCNETLRKPFYSDQWNYRVCEKHSIFIGSSSYPIKGFHYILEMLPRLLDEFPDAKVYVTGNSPLKNNGIKQRLRRTQYQLYLRNLINENNLADKVIFLGNLTAEEMKSRMLKSNVFILPSSIENSPNTLGEAMLLGVPSIVADVGGVRNMVLDKEEALIYPHEEYYMLPLYVKRIFNDFEYANKISLAARKHAAITHNEVINNQTLIAIYDEVGCHKKIGK